MPDFPVVEVRATDIRPPLPVPVVPYLTLVSTGKIFHDDFSEDTIATGFWTEARGYWAIDTVAKELRCTGGPAGGSYYLRTATLTILDGVLRIRIKAIAPSTYGDGRICSRMTGYVGTYDADGYPTTIRVGNTTSDADIIWKMVSDTGTVLASGPAGTRPTDTYYIAEHEFRGSTLKLKVYTDDMSIDRTDITATDTYFPDPGYVGPSVYSGNYNTIRWDYVQAFKSLQVIVSNLLEGQKVELYDSADVLVASDIVGTGETQAVLDVSTLKFPFNGYFKVYKEDGVTFWYRHPETGTVEVWGGDEWKQS